VSDRIPVELVGVRLQLPTNQPVVLLRESGGTRFLPIWIGAVEAAAIAYAVEGVVPVRPLTHDLLRLVADALGGTVARVVVTELRNAVFYADLVFERGGEEIHVSARPSDAIALAVRAGAPLFAAPEVIEDAGIEIRDGDEESEIERFREFLDEVSPEDFAPQEGPSSE
jgi:bifunctional DNase/RNase